MSKPIPVLELADVLEQTMFFALAEPPNENNHSMVQILTGGEWHHARYGKVTIGYKLMDAMRRNFEKFAMGNQTVVDFNHGTEKETPTAEQGKAAGWIQKLIMKGKDELWAVVKWTERAKELIASGEYRFISPAFKGNYRHPKLKGKSIGPWLASVALTNRPFLKGMQPVALSEKAAQLFNHPDLAEETMPDQIETKKGSDASPDDTQTAKLSDVKVNGVTFQVGEKSADQITKLFAEQGKKIEELTKQLAEARKDESDGMKLLREQNADLAKRFSDLEARHSSNVAAGLIADAVRAHKLSKAEADSDAWCGIATENPELFSQLIENKPVVVPKDPQGGDSPGPSGADAAAHKFNELVNDRYQDLKKDVDISEREAYSRALREVGDEHPDLAATEDGQIR